MVEIAGKRAQLHRCSPGRWTGAASWPELPNQRLMLRTETTQYLPGDTAKIFFPNPFEGDALALVTVERGRVIARR